MNRIDRVVVSSEGREEVYPIGALPLCLGGRESDAIRLPVEPTAGPLAQLGLDEGGAYVEALTDSDAILCDGEPLVGKRRLDGGEELRLGGARLACSRREGALHLELAAEDPAPAPLEAEVIAPTPFTPSSAAKPAARGRRLRPLAVATWGAALLLLALLWFSFTSVSVRLAIEPEPDEADVASWLQFQLGDRFLLRPGSHRVLVEKQGYYPLEAPIEVSGEADQLFSFTLEKLPGRLDLQTLPVDGARILEGDEQLGVSPVDDLPLSPGLHTLTLKAPRHLPATVEIEIEGADVEQRLEVELVPAWAPVEIASSPPGATLFVDDVRVGETPGSFGLDAGARRLALRLEGYNPWQRVLEVVADQPQSLETVVLAKADGRLRIESRPSGAQVVVGSGAAGRTPLEITLAPERLHEVSIFKTGYELTRRSVELSPGEERSLSVELRARLGTIDLVTRPAGAQLSVDGRAAGDATQALRLVSVPHTLVIRKEGYQEQELRVTPTPDYPQRVEIELEKIGMPRLDAAGVRRSAAGQALVRVDPGSFTMGSVRGEPDRRSNETQRPVRLSRAFFIGSREVSNREYRDFAPDHRVEEVSGFALDGDDQPVTGVSWEDAVRYCNWLSRRESLPPAYVERDGSFELATPIGIGYRLPSEAEWAWAARFAAGAFQAPFPWGAQPDPPPGSGNYADASAAGLVSSALLSYEDGSPVTSPVGSGAANPIGLFDVGGNVAEWVHDRYRIYPPARSGVPDLDPFGPSTGGLRVIRGSSWKHASRSQLRLAHRDYGKEGRNDVGFRIARYVE